MVEDDKRDPPVALVLREQLQQPLERGPTVRWHRQPNGHRVGQPFPHHLDGSDFCRQDSDRFIVPLETPVDEDTAAVLGMVTVLLERFGEDHNLDGSCRIIEGEDAHPVALTRLEWTEAGDDSAD